MTIALCIRRRLWIALAAVAASLPATARASEAKCEAMPAGCTTCSCCEDAAPTTDIDPALAEIAAPATRGMAVARPTSSPCVCRVDGPTAPAPRPGQSAASERRVETGRDVAADWPNHPGPRVPVASALRPPVGPPRSPIYLRTARLLIRDAPRVGPSRRSRGVSAPRRGPGSFVPRSSGARTTIRDAGRPPPPPRFGKGRGPRRAGREVYGPLRSGRWTMIRRRWMGAAAALALVALTGAWAGSARTVEAKVACGCCGDACSCSACTCAADASCCVKGCDCAECAGDACCTAR